MTPPPNQKFDLPRFSDGKLFLPGRSRFLDGTYKVFYGPGQRPDSGVQDGLDEFGSPLPGGKVYVPPEDWPTPGLLLRVPQVVFLSRGSRVRGLDTLLEYEARYVSPTFRPGMFVPFVYAYSWLPHVNPDAPEIVESKRLSGILTEVQNRLNTLRPGRTFCTYWGDWGWAKDFSSINVFDMYYTMDQFPAPPVTETDYFGVDFLNVRAGSPVARETLSGFLPVPDPIAHQDGAANECDPVPGNNDFFVGSEDRLKLVGSRFRRYESWSYVTRVGGGGVDWHDEDNWSLNGPYFFPDAPTVNEAMTLGFGTWTDVDPYPDVLHSGVEVDIEGKTDAETGVAMTAALISFIEGAVGDRIAERMRLTEIYNRTESISGDFMQSCCEELSPYGVNFKGLTQNVDTRTLIEEIAAHFGFDPDTGKDL